MGQSDRKIKKRGKRGGEREEWVSRGCWNKLAVGHGIIVLHGEKNWGHRGAKLIQLETDLRFTSFRKYLGGGSTHRGEEKR